MAQVKLITKKLTREKMLYQKKMSKKNQEYTSISIKPKEEQGQYVQKKEELSDVPF